MQIYYLSFYIPIWSLTPEIPVNNLYNIRGIYYQIIGKPLAQQ